MLKKNSEVTTHFMHSRYGNINLICPKYKRELDGGRSFTISAKLFICTYYFVVRYILFDACFDVIVLYIINSSFNYLRGPQICQSILLRVTLVK